MRFLLKLHRFLIGALGMAACVSASGCRRQQKIIEYYGHRDHLEGNEFSFQVARSESVTVLGPLDWGRSRYVSSETDSWHLIWDLGAPGSSFGIQPARVFFVSRYSEYFEGRSSRLVRSEGLQLPDYGTYFTADLEAVLLHERSAKLAKLGKGGEVKVHTLPDEAGKETFRQIMTRSNRHLLRVGRDLAIYETKQLAQTEQRPLGTPLKDMVEFLMKNSGRWFLTDDLRFFVGVPSFGGFAMNEVWIYDMASEEVRTHQLHCIHGPLAIQDVESVNQELEFLIESEDHHLAILDERSTLLHDLGQPTSMTYAGLWGPNNSRVLVFTSNKVGAAGVVINLVDLNYLTGSQQERLLISGPLSH